MNTLTYRRRWLLYRVWFKDISIAIAFAITIWLAMWLLGHLADLCTQIGACS